jgi:hypothetical protein
MATDPIWQDMFRAWPEGIARRGVVVNTLNEAIPFKGFMIKDETLLLERTNPDPMGTRYVLLTFDTIAVVKLVDPIKPEIFKKAGYQGQFSTL